MVIKGFRVGPLLKATGKEILNDNVLGLAAQAAYNAFFSIFPFFLFAAPMISLIGDKAKTFSWLMNQLATVVPSEAIALVQSVIKDVVFSKNAPGLMSVGAVLAAWSGGAVFGALMSTLNTAYNVTRNASLVEARAHPARIGARDGAARRHRERRDARRSRARQDHRRQAASRSLLRARVDDSAVSGRDLDDRPRVLSHLSLSARTSSSIRGRYSWVPSSARCSGCS